MFRIHVGLYEKPVKIFSNAGDGSDDKKSKVVPVLN
jgi:hypothetical protein